MRLNKNNLFEFSLLSIFFLALIFFSSNFENGIIDHQYPEQIVANDMFIFSGFADVAKYEDDMSKVPSYLSGGTTDALNFFSPLSGIVDAQISSFIGTETFNLIIPMNILFMIFSLLGMYILLRRINVNAALLSLPFFLLLFSWPFTFIINWGGHIGNMNIFLVIISLISFIHLKERKMFILFGFFNAASFLSHGREFQSFQLGMILFFVIYFFKDKIFQKIIKTKFKFKQIFKLFKKDIYFIYIKNYFFASIIAFLAIFPWWRGLYGFISSNTDNAASLIMWNYNPLFHQVTFENLGLFNIFLIIGFLLGLYLIIKKNDFEFNTIYIFSFFFFLSGIIMFLGNNLPQARAFYLVTLLPFLFLFFKLIIQFIKRELIQKITTFLIFIILLTFVAYSYAPSEIQKTSFLPEQTYDALKWMENNFDDSTVLVLSCNSCSQKASFLPARVSYHLVREKDLTNQISTLELSSNYLVDIFPVHHKFENQENSLLVKSGFIPEKEIRNLCDYKYLYLEITNSNQIISQYSVLVANKLIEENGFSIIYTNNLSVILENPIIGQTCFNETKLEVKKNE